MKKDISAKAKPQAKSKAKKLISVAIPCYNEEEVIEEFYKSLKSTLAKSKFDFEMVFADDGSADNTVDVLSRLAKKDKSCKLVVLSRNFGHQIAATAAIESCKGDAVVLIDADLQDPPEVILQMLEKWQEGYDVVYGKRMRREGESWFKVFSASLFYRLFNMSSSIKIPLDTGDFRLMSRRVVDTLLQMPENDRFIRGMVSWVGLKQTPIYYDRDARFAGGTKYSFGKMLKFAANGIFSFSASPLKIASWFGLIAASLAIVGVFYTLYRFYIGETVPGWAFLSVVILFFSGVQLFCLGVLGEYLGRVYREGKGRPLYVVDKYINL